MPYIATVSLGANVDLKPATGQLRAFTSKKYPLHLDDKFSGSLNAITASTKNFDQSLAKATNRVVAFGAAAAVFNTARRAFQAFAKDTIDVEDSLTKINVNLGESADGLKKFSADLFNVARQTGQSFETASKAAEEFARQGLSAEETIKRTKDALVLSRIAAIDSTEAVNDLTAAVNSYAKEALTTTDIINKFVALDTQFAVNSKDLADSLQRAGAVAAESGLSLDKFLAIVTAIKQETGRSGAIIGNSLKTIFERAKSPETLKDFEELGIATKDLEGNLLPVDRILNNLASSFDHLSQAQQKQVAKSIANIQQINVFKVLLKDLSSSYSVTARAAEVSGNAQDQAIQKNLALNKTLKSAINSTEVTITEFFSSLGNQSIGPLFKNVLEGFENFRKSIAADDETGKTIGQSIVKGIANVLTGPGLAIVGFALAQAFKKIAGTIGGEFQSLLGLNTVSRQRVTIQETINGLLSQANKAELEAFNIAGSTLQRQEALLAIKTRIASIDESSALVNSFIGPGALGGGSSVNKRLTGKVGNFVDPLQSAIAREVAAGVPKSLIYIDRDPRLVGPNNPQGLLVANRRDEPAGGFQGVNRVIAQGGDPKSAGTIRIPHFAISSNEALSLGAAAVRPGGPEGFAKSLDISGINFDVNIKKIRKQILDAIGESLKVDISALGPVPKRAFGKLATEVLTIRQQDIATLQASQITKRNAEVEAIQRTNGLSQYQSPIGPSVPPGRVINVVPKNLNILSAQTTKASPEQLAAYEAERAASAARPSQTSFGPAGLIPRRPSSNLGSISQQLGGVGFFGSEEKDVKRLRALGVNTNSNKIDELLRSRDLSRQSRRQNAGLIAALALPVAAGFIPEGKGGTTKGQLSGAAQGAAQFGSVGLLSGNLLIAGISAGVGALAGAFGKLSKSVEEFDKEINDTTTASRNAAEGAQRIAQIYAQIEDAKREGGDPKTLDRLNNQLFNEINNTRDSGARERFSKGFSNAKEANEFADQQAQTSAGVAASGNISSIINRQSQDNAFSTIGKFLERKGFTGQISQSFRRIGDGTPSPEDRDKDRRELSDAIREKLNKDNIGKIDQKFISSPLNATNAQGNITDEGARKLSKTFGDLGVDVAVTEDNFRKLRTSLKDAVDAFLAEKKNLEAFRKGDAPVTVNARSFLSKSFETSEGGEFSTTRQLNSGFLPNSQRSKDLSFLNSISQIDQQGGFGAEGLDKSYESQSPLVVAKKQAEARVSKQGLLQDVRDRFGGLPEARNTRFLSPRGEISEGAVTSLLSLLSKSKEPEKAVLAQNYISRLAEKNQNIVNLSANKPGPQLVDYRGSEPGIRTSTLGGGDKLAASRYFDSNKTKTFQQENDSITTMIKSLDQVVSKASDVVAGLTLQVDGTIRLVSDSLSDDAQKELADQITVLIGKQVKAVSRKTDVLKGKVDNKPVPPSQFQDFGD